MGASLRAALMTFKRTGAELASGNTLALGLSVEARNGLRGRSDVGNRGTQATCTKPVTSASFCYRVRLRNNFHVGDL